MDRSLLSYFYYHYYHCFRWHLSTTNWCKNYQNRWRYGIFNI